MRRACAYAVVCSAFLLQACSGDDSNGGASDGGSHADATSQNDAAGKPDTGSPNDSGGGTDTGTSDGGGCPAAWLAPPTVDPVLALPDGGGAVIIHAAAEGTQDYTCTMTTVDGGTVYQWTFTGPEATLKDCNAATIGHHFASDAGPAAPEWMTVDDSYVIAKKVAGETPDGGASAVAWLLLQATSHGGSGPIASTTYVHRVNTTGGLAPTTGCAEDGGVGTSQKVPYTADYYFYAP